MQGAIREYDDRDHQIVPATDATFAKFATKPKRLLQTLHHDWGNYVKRIRNAGFYHEYLPLVRKALAAAIANQTFEAIDHVHSDLNADAEGGSRSSPRAAKRV